MPSCASLVRKEKKNTSNNCSRHFGGGQFCCQFQVLVFSDLVALRLLCVQDVNVSVLIKFVKIYKIMIVILP